MDRWYRRMRAHVDADPDWTDDELVYDSCRRGAEAETPPLVCAPGLRRCELRVSGHQPEPAQQTPAVFDANVLGEFPLSSYVVRDMRSCAAR